MASKPSRQGKKTKVKGKVAPPQRRAPGALNDAALDGVTGGATSLRAALPGVDGAAALPSREVATCLSQV
jgi:hypothetical protein